MQSSRLSEMASALGDPVLSRGGDCRALPRSSKDQKLFVYDGSYRVIENGYW